MPLGSAAALPLHPASLPRLKPLVRVPTYRAADLRSGVVHLGLGAFARSHQAVYFDRIAEHGISRDWGMIGAGLRTAGVAGALAQQGNLWTVCAGDEVRVVGVLQAYLAATREHDSLLAALVTPSVRLVTLTLTAPAYEPAAATAPGSPFRLLARAVGRRLAAGTAPFAVLSCDNLPDNGAAARRALLLAAETLDPRLADRIRADVAFPSSMVDRITPTTSEVRRQALAHSHGLVDRLALFPEAFSRWVVSDDLGPAAAPLREVGVEVVRDVRPYVDAKTRLLNGSHVALGYLGGQAGHRTSAEAMADPRVAALVRGLLQEVEPTLRRWFSRSELTAQRSQVLARLADPTVPDTLARLRLRGSVRIGNYVVPTLRDALAAGTPSATLTRVVAAWVAHLRTFADRDASLDVLADPLAARLVPAARQASLDARPLLGISEVFADLGRNPRFVASFQEALCDLEEGVGAVAS